MEPSTRVDVFLRNSVPFHAKARQLVTRSRLRSLQSAGVVDEVRVDTWANRTTDTDRNENRSLPVLDELQAWADEHGVRLTPGFDSHDTHCGFTGRDFRTTVFPVVCLAVYEHDELVGVYPHSTDSGSVSVADCLSVLEAGALTAAPESVATATDRDRPTP
jgi:hypothetical protein